MLGTISLATALLLPVAAAHDYNLGDIQVVHPWSPATPAGASVAAGYMTVRNSGTAPDRLIAVETEIAGKSEVHQMALNDAGMMSMRPVAGGLEIPAGGFVELKPGSYHLMLSELKQPPLEGQNINEYISRVHASQDDFAQFLSDVDQSSTNRGSIVLEFGDHQSYVTKTIADMVAGKNSLTDLRSISYKNYYTVHSFGRIIDSTPFEVAEMDVSFLAASLLQAANLPKSSMFEELARLRDICAERFSDCFNRPAIETHIRRRVDSGLLTLW